MSTQIGTGRPSAAPRVRRVAGMVAVSAVLLVVAPGVATAAPIAPSDAQIGAAQQEQDAAAQRVGALSAQLATAQAEVDAARAGSAIALDAFQGKQAEYEAAQATADAAAAAAAQADADLAAARADVATFARQSYIEGSTSPGLRALTTSGGPAEMLERAALLDAAGTHRADVVLLVTAAQQQAAAADAEARTALDAAAALKDEAARALAAAEQLEVAARAQATELATQQATVEAQLQQAQQALLGLEGARAAARQYAAEQAAAEQRAAAAARPAPRPAASSSAAAPATRALAAGRPATTAGSADGSAVETAIASARRWLGTTYAWGGGSLSGPSMGFGVDAGIVGFDCSGLTRYAYAQAGISLPRNSSAQYGALPTVPRADLQRGDLVFWATDTGSPSTIHHVALYLGDGQVLEAPQSGSAVRVSSMRWSGFIGGARPSA
ncbi:C40 family peptidase [Modestobacter sp. I12A-02662]|uniref:C40 family peptidase n=1 Tax=Modestobacter sp. I12A-02662 TaxID=1730496 RepID=UPI0034E020B5